MKKRIVLFLVLIVPYVLFGQEKGEPPKSTPLLVTEIREASRSNYIETFSDAFKDPNVLIGVFEMPEGYPYNVILPSGEKLRDIPDIWKVLDRFTPLHCVKSIKGEFTEPIIFVYTFPIIYMSLSSEPPVPSFISPQRSKWILALKKTSQEYRSVRFRKEMEDIEKFNFLNDNTVFMPFRYGHGALCLKWPDENEKWTELKPKYLVEVPESTVDDFKSILQVVPYTKKEKMTINEKAAVNRTLSVLKTEVAKNIFTKIMDKSQKENSDTNNPCVNCKK